MLNDINLNGKMIQNSNGLCMQVGWTRILACALLALLTVTNVGCEKKPVLVTTERPTSSEIELCRLRLYLNRGVDVESLGFQHFTGGGDIIWFKFKTKVVNLPNLFSTLKGAQVQEVSKFELAYEMPEYDDTKDRNPEWWDPGSFNLVGGRIDTPSTEILSIGVSNADGKQNPGEPATVYILLKKV